jgi:integrase
MASIKQLPSGFWRVQVRRKGLYASKTFRIKSEAQRWANSQEDRIDRGEGVSKRDRPTETLGDLIELHLADMADVGRAARRSKEYTLNRLKETLGNIRTSALTRESIVEFGRRRAKAGAGPVTVAVDISYLGTVLRHASAVYGYQVPTEQLRLGRAALVHLGLIATSNERNRRPTQAELDRIMSRIIKFAIATTMRQEEITRVLWEDLNADASTIVIRQRKHPRQKKANDQSIPLVSDTGYDAMALLAEQAAMRGRKEGVIFPYNPRSIGHAFRRVCRDLQIHDLHFHDLRHEGVSRLFEADWDIPQVATVSGHRDWKMLQRYTHLRPSFIASRAGRVRKPRVA